MGINSRETGNNGMMAVVFDIASARCDFCHDLYESPSVRCGGQITLTRRDPPEFDMGYGHRFDLVPPYSYNQLAKDLNESGWNSEVIHGKQFIICPSCAEKPLLVEGSIPDAKPQAD